MWIYAFLQRIFSSSSHFKKFQTKKIKLLTINDWPDWRVKGQSMTNISVLEFYLKSILYIYFLLELKFYLIIKILGQNSYLNGLRKVWEEKVICNKKNCNFTYKVIQNLFIIWSFAFGIQLFQQNTTICFQYGETLNQE